MSRALSPLPCLFCLAVMAMVAGCAEFPELDRSLNAAARAAPYPTLLSADQLAALAQPTPVATSNDLSARIATLDAKANRLRQSVLSNSEAARLRDGVAVPAAIR